MPIESVMMDYFFLQAIVQQLQPQLQGAILNKVFQPLPQVLILRLWNGGKQQRLLINTAGATSGLYITDQPYRNPVRPPRFSQLLRARLHRLISIDMDEFDRIIRLEFSAKNEETYTLIAELFGREGNLYLLDSQQSVIDMLHRPLPQAKRMLAVGQPYTAPTLCGTIPLITAATEVENNIELSLSAWLQENVIPMSRAVALTLDERSQHSSAKTVIDSFVSCWQDKTLQPCWRDKVLTMTTGTAPLKANLSMFAQQGYADTDTDKLVPTIDNNAELHKVVQKGLKRLRQRMKKIEQQIDQCLSADENRIKGDLLLANLHLLRRGMKCVQVQNYFQDPPQEIEILLDSAKTPNENANSYFKRYSKAKRGLDHCARRQQQTSEELEWLEQIDHQLSDALNPADCDLIRQELIDSGWYKPLTALQRDTRHVPAASLAKRDKSPNGWEIIWGSNNKTNDYLTKNLLKARDLWFHAHKIPGCHLILKCAGASVEDIDLLYAAKIAAEHSRAAQDSNVEVMVTEGKHVQRIKGAPLGLVKVEQYRVVQVRMHP